MNITLLTGEYIEYNTPHHAGVFDFTYPYKRPGDGLNLFFEQARVWVNQGQDFDLLYPECRAFSSSIAFIAQEIVKTLKELAGIKPDLNVQIVSQSELFVVHFVYQMFKAGMQPHVVVCSEQYSIDLFSNGSWNWSLLDPTESVQLKSAAGSGK